MPNKKQLLSLIIIIGLLISLIAGLILVGKKQEIRKHASASKVTLSLYPTTENINVGETKSFDLKATFTGGSSSEKLDYFKTEVTFSKEYLEVPSGKYVETSFTENETNFDKIFRVDGPTAANNSGKIIIELGASTPGSGPSTDKPLTIARIYFQGVKQTPSAQKLSIGATEVVNSQSSPISSTSSFATYTVGSGGGGGEVPTPTSGSLSTSTPEEVSPTPTSSATPSAGATIDVGDKDSLTVTIGGGVDANVPHIRFQVKLFGAENTPEIKVKLKVVDLAARLTPAPSSVNSCQEPGDGEYFYKGIAMVAEEDGVYHPKGGASFSYGSSQLSITSDGWIPLEGVTPGKIYSLSVKGPKHRNIEMVSSFKLENGNPSSQDFDWTSKLLEPGDLENPNDAGKQDCVVSSIDLSLITDRIGATSDTDLRIADVNYDGVINGNDVSQVVNTLSTKPDDDI